MNQSVFLTGLGAFITYSLFDTGLANLLNLETLRHGTGPKGYILINLFGADPKYGGCSSGSSTGIDSKEYVQSSKNFFYVFKDSEFPPSGRIVDWESYVLPHLLPRMHAILSGLATCHSSVSSLMSRPFRSILGGFLGLLTPTLNFRFRPEEILFGHKNKHLFMEDFDYGGLAYRTVKPIKFYHLGIMGSLTQGLDNYTIYRIANNPQKTIRGIIILACAYFTGNFTCKYWNKSSVL